MPEILLDDIPFQPATADLLKRLHIKAGSPSAREFSSLLEEAQAVARPKALYKDAYIEARGEDFTRIDGVILTSRVLAVNLQDAQRVFPFIVTCGVEIESWAGLRDDPLLRFWADAIMEAALFSAYQALECHQVETFQIGHTAVMNPGSLEDWPLPQQRNLFSLFESPEVSIGVQLTDSFLMLPRKSVSGIRFPLEVTFESCQLCPRQVCPSRRAPYDPDLYEERFASKSSPDKSRPV